MEGFNKTGIPRTVWDLVEPYAKINNFFGIAVLAIVILVLSNLASNVPAGTVMFTTRYIQAVKRENKH